MIWPWQIHPTILRFLKQILFFRYHELLDFFYAFYSKLTLLCISICTIDNWSIYLQEMDTFLSKMYIIHSLLWINIIILFNLYSANSTSVLGKYSYTSFPTSCYIFDWQFILSTWASRSKNFNILKKVKYMKMFWKCLDNVWICLKYFSAFWKCLNMFFKCSSKYLPLIIIGLSKHLDWVFPLFLWWLLESQTNNTRCCCWVWAFYHI